MLKRCHFKMPEVAFFSSSACCSGCVDADEEEQDEDDEDGDNGDGDEDEDEQKEEVEEAAVLPLFSSFVCWDFFFSLACCF
mmetsp:Transcript_11822/g.16895  ORF Transcript_11822/g.16895 Transcript_11822/m.16895 type:complete len:81 (-) Transcript_11822:123-365(-)